MVREYKGIYAKKQVIISNFIQKIEISKNLSSLTVKAYISDLSDYMNFYEEFTVSKQAVIGYIEHLRNERCLKDSTIKRKLITLSALFAYLVEESLLEDNPIDKLKFQFKKERRLPKTLSVREVTNVLKAIDRKLSNVKSEFSNIQNIRMLLF